MTRVTRIGPEAVLETHDHQWDRISDDMIVCNHLYGDGKRCNTLIQLVRSGSQQIPVEGKRIYYKLEDARSHIGGQA